MMPEIVVVRTLVVIDRPWGLNVWLTGSTEKENTQKMELRY